MPALLSKSAFARLHNKSPASVSHWIARRQLTAPALRSDGKIDVELANLQLGLTVDQVRSAAWATRIDRLSAGRLPKRREPASADEEAARQLLIAKAQIAEVQAAKAWRELQLERGRYILTEEIRAEFGRGIMDHLQSVEQSLPDLATELELGREGLFKLRGWWRQQCQYTADRNRLEAANFPQYMEDPDDRSQ